MEGGFGWISIRFSHFWVGARWLTTCCLWSGFYYSVVVISGYFSSTAVGLIYPKAPLTIFITAVWVCGRWCGFSLIFFLISYWAFPDGDIFVCDRSPQLSGCRSLATKRITCTRILIFVVIDPVHRLQHLCDLIVADFTFGKAVSNIACPT